MILRFNITLFKYQLIVLWARVLGCPKYMYGWYECAIKVKKEDLFRLHW